MSTSQALRSAFPRWVGGRRRYNAERQRNARQALRAAHLLRMRYGYRLADIAEVAGVAESTVSRWFTWLQKSPEARDMRRELFAVTLRVGTLADDLARPEAA